MHTQRHHPSHTEHINVDVEETRNNEIFIVTKCSECGLVESEKRIARYVAPGMILNTVDTKQITITSTEGLKNFNGIFTGNYKNENGNTVAKRFFNEKTVTLACDADLTGYEWIPIEVDSSTQNVVFEGANHTIKGLTLNGSTAIGFFGKVSVNLTVKNLNFEGAKLTTTGKWCGILVGQQDGGNLTVDKVNFNDCKVWGTVEPKAIRIGCVIGYCNTDGCSAFVTNCSVENSSFWGYHNTCALIGTLANAQNNESRWNISGCSVKNNTFKIGATNPKYVNPYTCDTYYMERDAMEAYITNKGNVQENNTFEYGITENPFTVEQQA